jgi:4a-hydroxytetrahydrobiopterin dehydratase
MEEDNLTKFKKLNPIEIRQRLADMKASGWEVVQGRLEKQYRFQNFARSMVFLNKIINPIEEFQNYPRISIVYDRVHVSLFTNHVGSITVMDLEMAMSFDELAGPAAPHGMKV